MLSKSSWNKHGWRSFLSFCQKEQSLNHILKRENSFRIYLLLIRASEWFVHYQYFKRLNVVKWNPHVGILWDVMMRVIFRISRKTPRVKYPPKLNYFHRCVSTPKLNLGMTIFNWHRQWAVTCIYREWEPLKCKQYFLFW